MKINHEQMHTTNYTKSFLKKKKKKNHTKKLIPKQNNSAEVCFESLLGTLRPISKWKNNPSPIDKNNYVYHINVCQTIKPCRGM